MVSHASAWNLKRNKTFVSVDQTVNSYWLTTSSPDYGSREYLKTSTNLYLGYGVRDNLDVGFNLLHERITVGDRVVDYQTQQQVGTRNTSLNSDTLALWFKFSLYDSQKQATDSKHRSEAWSLMFSWRTPIHELSRKDYLTGERLDYRNQRQSLSMTLSYGLKFNNQRKLKLNNLNIPYSGEYNFFATDLTYTKIFDSFFDEIVWHNSFGVRMHNFALLLLESTTTIPIYALGGNGDDYHAYYHELYYGTYRGEDAKHHGIIRRKNAHSYKIPNKYGTEDEIIFHEYDAISNGTKLSVSAITTFSHRLSTKFSLTYNVDGKDRDTINFGVGLWFIW